MLSSGGIILSILFPTLTPATSSTTMKVTQTSHLLTLCIGKTTVDKSPKTRFSYS